MDATDTSICSFCGNQIPTDAFFCPRCGKQVKEAPLSTSVFTQTWIYLVSVLLPPLGLWPGVKYFKHSDPRAKQIGIVAIVLTVASLVITTWLTISFLNSYLNDINKALNGSIY